MAKRRSQADHDRMVRLVANFLMRRGYHGVRADIPDFERPNRRTWPGTDRGHVPDVTGYGFQFSIFEVETSDSIRDEHTEDEWSLFSNYAKKHFSKFWLVVPGGYSGPTMQRLARLGIEAKVWELDAEGDLPDS